MDTETVAAAASAVPSDAVEFEVADLPTAARLTRRLAPTRMVDVRQHADCTVVTVTLGRRPTDVAALLREVERFIAEESLCALRFRLDGRTYVLESGDADWNNVPAGSCA
jgi:hypothetical protein